MTVCYTLFYACISKHNTVLKTIVFNYLGTGIHQRKDFEQDFWMKLNKKPEVSTAKLNGVLVGDPKCRAWFIKVARNLFLDAIKKNESVRRNEKGHAKRRQETDGSENTAAMRIDLDYIISMLKKDYQRCYNLYMEGFKNIEIAEIMNKSAATISNMLKTIRQFIKDHLGGDNSAAPIF